MCEEESDDQEAVAKLFEINDSIHRTIERYKLIKKGDVDGASKIPQGTLGTSTGVSKTADNELSLIDFSGDPEPVASASGNLNGSVEQKSASMQDDLLGLSIQDQDYGQGGGIALGFGANSSKKAPKVLLEILLTSPADVPGPSLLSSTTQESSAKASAPTATPQPQQIPLPAKPNYDPFKFVTNSLSSSRSSTPAPPTLLQNQQTSRPPKTSTDPFASLSSTASRTASPLPMSQPPQKPVPSQSASLFDFASPKPTVLQNQPTANFQQATNGASADDDWDFTSALPDDGPELPSRSSLTVSNTSVKMEFRVERPEAATDSSISISASFSNNTPSLITEYTLQVAVTKVNFTRCQANYHKLLIGSDRGLRSSLHRSLGVPCNQISKTGSRSTSSSTVSRKGKPIPPRYAGKLPIKLLAKYGKSKERCLHWVLLDIAAMLVYRIFERKGYTLPTFLPSHIQGQSHSVYY